MAKISALQGNYPKAIYAYEQLILTNPEKKVFFASQSDESVSESGSIIVELHSQILLILNSDVVIFEKL